MHGTSRMTLTRQQLEIQEEAFMENAAQALHNAVRRYCYDHYQQWCDVYANIAKDDRAGAYRYNAQQLDTFPRYNVLNAIRVEVERIDADQLDDFDDTQRILDSIGETANDDSTQNPIDPVSLSAQDEERSKYSSFVGSLTEESVWCYDRLPYQRVLTEAESNAVRQGLSIHWGITSVNDWYPLNTATENEIVAFDALAFHQSVPTHALSRLIGSLANSRIYELREYGPSYIQDVESLSPIYNGAEGFWTADGFDWVLYASHEATITVAGELSKLVKASWPNWTLHEVKPL